MVWFNCITAFRTMMLDECLMSLTCLWAISTQAQTGSDQPTQVSQEQTLRQLLAEVHGLRVALERATVPPPTFKC